MDIAFNDGWLFAENYESGFENAVSVRLPHTTKEIEYNYFNCEDYQRVSGYKKVFYAEPEWKNKALLLKFDGAAHDASVFVNGQMIARHKCGYTAFTADITPAVKFGAYNEIIVKLDSRETLNIPPFGFVIDYLAYGGLYREVTLQVKNPGYIRNVKIENSDLYEVTVGVETDSHEKGTVIQTDILDSSGNVAASCIGGSFTVSIPEGTLWSIDAPYLYTARVRVFSNEKALIDEKKVRFGLRTAVFKADGFYLNNKKTKLRGLNRHQSYPYVGYAMPESMQKLDADILKNELGVNAVRTSHYPQSQHFLDRCDELGLLVFTEIPGWQHIGDEEWKKQAVINTEEMVLQYMHHPSIVLWGVRINESQDCDELYIKTNQAAHRIDRYRQTSGVRFLEKSHLLEDVYAFNDFSHNGTNDGLKPKNKVTPKKQKPYLISECNGHMFPTKPFDDERHRLDHALRHAVVINSAYAADEICGIFPWCMFDYNTHKDFGSGDGICYHGVMDMFRNPKLAAAVFTSQSENIPCCEVSSSMDIGEHPAGDIGKVYVFTNADCIKLYKNGDFVKEFNPCTEQFPAMPHPPVVIDDFIGDLIITKEGFEEKTANTIKECFNAISKYGPGGLPPKYIAKLAKLMLLKGFKISDGYELYGKYVGNWGGEATEWRFDAVKDGKTIKSIVKKPGRQVHIVCTADHTVLEEKSTYDVAEIRIRAVDEFGNTAHYYQEPVKLTAVGDIEIIGPDVISLKGGCGGVYIKSLAKSGQAQVHVNDIVINFEIKA